jgi:hypothetical protein
MQIDLTPILHLFEKVFVLLLAPAGIWFGWYLQRKDKAEDQARRQQEQLRAKAEEVFAELSAIQTAAKDAVLHALRDLQGKLEGPPGFSPEVSFDRLNALLWMYFPGAEQIMVDYARGISESATKHSELFAEMEANPGLTLEEKLKRIKQSSLDTANADLTLTIKTVSELRMFMSEQVKKLK